MTMPTFKWTRRLYAALLLLFLSAILVTESAKRWVEPSLLVGKRTAWAFIYGHPRMATAVIEPQKPFSMVHMTHIHYRADLFPSDMVDSFCLIIHRGRIIDTMKVLSMSRRRPRMPSFQTTLTFLALLLPYSVLTILKYRCDSRRGGRTAVPDGNQERPNSEVGSSGDGLP